MLCFTSKQGSNILGFFLRELQIKKLQKLDQLYIVLGVASASVNGSVQHSVIIVYCRAYETVMLNSS
ncbi:hypothetical protein D3C77_598340 [compost metagenome]